MSARQRHESALLCRAPGVTDDALRRAILDLGLEDRIPLWEITDTCRAVGVIADGPTGVESLVGALLALARKDEIRILVGRWDDPEPQYADRDEVETLLADARRYSSADETAHDLERVYYVSVDNIAEYRDRTAA
jgi:hypothetical protein